MSCLCNYAGFLDSTNSNIFWDPHLPLITLFLSCIVVVVHYGSFFGSFYFLFQIYTENHNALYNPSISVSFSTFFGGNTVKKPKQRHKVKWNTPQEKLKKGNPPSSDN